LKKALLRKEKKNLKEETWQEFETLQELDEKALTAIQFCLVVEVLDEFFSEKIVSSLWE